MSFMFKDKNINKACVLSENSEKKEMSMKHTLCHMCLNMSHVIISGQSSSYCMRHWGLYYNSNQKLYFVSNKKRGNWSRRPVTPDEGSDSLYSLKCSAARKIEYVTDKKRLSCCVAWMLSQQSNQTWRETRFRLCIQKNIWKRQLCNDYSINHT